jgi:uncharacterized membrane protein
VGGRGVERLEAFSDGVFAIAITLLILEIRVPATKVATIGLRHALGEEWSSYIAYTLSFAIIGIMWANHHNIFRYIGRANHALVVLNLGLLFFVAFLPFPTAILAEYLPSPENRTTATVFYAANLVGTALFFNVMWRYATHSRRLIRADADQGAIDGVTREYRFGPLLYAGALAIAFVNVWVCLAIHAGLAALFALPSRSRP